MAEELQALLDRINEQGIEKAEEERRQRLEQAKKEAANIVSEAKKEADEIVATAREEAELLSEKGRDSLRQAARDTVLSLRERLEERAAKIAQEAVAEDLNPQAIADFIASMIDDSTAQKGDRMNIEAQVPDKVAKELRKHLLARLGEDLKEHVELTPVKDMEGGFRISIGEENVFYDFSDTALADVLCMFLNPRLAEVVRPALSTDSTDESANRGGEAREAGAAASSEKTG